MPAPRNPSLVRRTAYAICDADTSVENMKHGHRCTRGGCLVGGRELCIAFAQAKAAIAVVEAREALANDIAA